MSTPDHEHDDFILGMFVEYIRTITWAMEPDDRFPPDFRNKALEDIAATSDWKTSLLAAIDLFDKMIADNEFPSPFEGTICHLRRLAASRGYQLKPASESKITGLWYLIRMPSGEYFRNSFDNDMDYFDLQHYVEDDEDIKDTYVTDHHAYRILLHLPRLPVP